MKGDMKIPTDYYEENSIFQLLALHNCSCRAQPEAAQCAVRPPKNCHSRGVCGRSETALTVLVKKS